MPYISTTLGQDSHFPIYKKVAGNELAVERVITIKGGANVISNKTLFTPSGRLNKVSDEDLKLLEQNPAFCRKRERGYIVVHPDKQLHVEDLQKKDGSAQFTEKDFKTLGVKAPSTSQDEELTKEEKLEAEEAFEAEEKLKDAPKKRGRKAQK